MFLTPRVALGAVLTALSCSGAVMAQEDQLPTLEFGKVIEARATRSEPAACAFTVDQAGLITLASRGGKDTDLVLWVTDEDGQALPEAKEDSGYGGVQSAEQMATVIPAAGNYRVYVSLWGGSSGEATFNLAASWLPFPAVGRAGDADADDRPSGATALQIGKKVTDSLAEGTDPWDWYMVSFDQAGTFTIVTKDAEGDLVLEAYKSDKFLQPDEDSDQDIDGVKGAESLTLTVAEGDQVYFRVRLRPGDGGNYTLQSVLMPD